MLGRQAASKEDHMKCRLLTVALTAGLVGGLSASPAAADPGIGAPANPSCAGQNASNFAQQYGGIANAAAAFNLTIPEGHNIVRGAVCGRTSGLVPIG
jgi:hypothetical protein